MAGTLTEISPKSLVKRIMDGERDFSLPFVAETWCAKRPTQIDTVLMLR